MQSSRIDTTKRYDKTNNIMLIAYAIAMVFCVVIVFTAVAKAHDAIQDFKTSLEQSEGTP